MEKGEDIVRVFSDTEITVNLIKSELEKIGIPSLIKNDFQSGVIAGFGGGLPNGVDLYVNHTDYDNAMTIIEEFRGVQ